MTNTAGTPRPARAGLVAVLALVLSALGGPAAPAAADGDWQYCPPEDYSRNRMVNFYDGATGEAAAGVFLMNGDFTQYPASTTLFSTGWTHRVPLTQGDESCRSFVYNAATGAGAVVTIQAWRHYGEYLTLSSYPSGTFTQGWTNIVEIEPIDGTPRLLFYRSSDGLVAIARVAIDGSITTEASRQPTTCPPRSSPWQPQCLPSSYFGTGWTHIVHLDQDLFFYDRLSGCAVEMPGAIEQGRATARVSGSYGCSLSPGWTDIGYLPSWAPYHHNPRLARMVFYNRSNGVLVTAWPAGDLTGFWMETLGVFQLEAGYSSVVVIDRWAPEFETDYFRQGVLLYSATDGSYRIADINNDGAYLHLRYGTFSPGWSLVTFNANLWEKPCCGSWELVD